MMWECLRSDDGEYGCLWKVVEMGFNGLQQKGFQENNKIIKKKKKMEERRSR